MTEPAWFRAARAPRRAALALALCALGMSAGAVRAADVRVSGLAEVTLAGGDEAIAENWLNLSDTNFDPYRFRLFVDGEAAPGLEAFVQLAFGEYRTFKPYGAYLRWTPDENRDLRVLGGKIPWVLGTWAPRAYPDRNPLIGAPLMHQYHTSLRADAVPPDADALLAARGTGQYSPNYGAGGGYKGMPIVYDRCWDFGVALQGSARPFEYALALANGTPATPNPEVDTNESKTVLGRIGLAPVPALRFGISGSRGAYLPYALEDELPPGTEPEDLLQVLWCADLELAGGHAELRGEAYLNTFETATVGDLEVRGGYGEAKLTVHPGVWIALRAETMRFSDLQGSSGPAVPWDDRRDRIEAGAGWRVARGAWIKAAFQRNTRHAPAGVEHRDLAAAQIVARF